MIQDIFPHIYDNSFLSRRAPVPEDPVLCCQKGKILVKKAGEDGRERISFPKAEDFMEAGARGDHGAGSVPADDQTEVRTGGGEPADNGFYRTGDYVFIYLFSIDGTPYYSIDGLAELPEAVSAGYSWESIQLFRTAEPLHLAYAAITGMQLFRWRQDHFFCGHCGSRMHPSPTERAFVCDSCGAVVYPKICPAVIVAVTHGDSILLTKYAGRDYTRYALIAGFAEIGEMIEDTVRREVMEEVGLKVKNLRFYKSQPWSLSDTLLMGFFCELDGNSDTITLDREELAVGEWKKRSELPDRRGDISLTSEMMEQFRLGLV